MATPIYDIVYSRHEKGDLSGCQKLTTMRNYVLSKPGVVKIPSKEFAPEKLRKIARLFSQLVNI